MQSHCERRPKAAADDPPDTREPNPLANPSCKAVKPVVLAQRAPLEGGTSRPTDEAKWERPSVEPPVTSELASGDARPRWTVDRIRRVPYLQGRERGERSNDGVATDGAFGAHRALGERAR